MDGKIGNANLCSLLELGPWPELELGSTVFMARAKVLRSEDWSVFPLGLIFLDILVKHMVCSLQPRMVKRKGNLHSANNQQDSHGNNSHGSKPLPLLLKCRFFIHMFFNFCF